MKKFIEWFGSILRRKEVHLVFLFGTRKHTRRCEVMQVIGDMQPATRRIALNQRRHPLKLLLPYRGSA